MAWDLLRSQGPQGLYRGPETSRGTSAFWPGEPSKALLLLPQTLHRLQRGVCVLRDGQGEMDMVLWKKENTDDDIQAIHAHEK